MCKTVCKKCNGEGYVLEWTAPMYGEDLDNHENNYEKKTCPECDGECYVD